MAQRPGRLFLLRLHLLGQRQLGIDRAGGGLLRLPRGLLGAGEPVEHGAAQRAVSLGLLPVEQGAFDLLLEFGAVFARDQGAEARLTVGCCLICASWPVATVCSSSSSETRS